MNERVKKILLTGDKFMPEIHVGQPSLLDKSGFLYSACVSFTKNKPVIQKFKETGNSRYIYQKELHKTCFQHDRTYGDSKYLTRRTASDKILLNKAFNIAKNPKHDGLMDIKGVLLQWFIHFLIKKNSGGAATAANKSAIKNENI